MVKGRASTRQSEKPECRGGPGAAVGHQGQRAGQRAVCSLPGSLWVCLSPQLTTVTFRE